MGGKEQGNNINPLEAFITLLLSKELDNDNGLFNQKNKLSSHLDDFKNELYKKLDENNQSDTIDDIEITNETKQEEVKEINKEEIIEDE